MFDTDCKDEIHLQVLFAPWGQMVNSQLCLPIWVFDSDMDNSDMNTNSRLTVVASGVADVHPQGCSCNPQGASYSIQEP